MLLLLGVRVVFLLLSAVGSTTEVPMYLKNRDRSASGESPSLPFGIPDPSLLAFLFIRPP